MVAKARQQTRENFKMRKAWDDSADEKGCDGRRLNTQAENKWPRRGSRSLSNTIGTHGKRTIMMVSTEPTSQSPGPYPPLFPKVA